MAITGYVTTIDHTDYRILGILSSGQLTTTHSLNRVAGQMPHIVPSKLAKLIKMGFVEKVQQGYTSLYKITADGNLFYKKLLKLRGTENNPDDRGFLMKREEIEKENVSDD